MKSSLIGLSTKDWKALQSADPAIGAIRQRSTSGAEISFSWLRGQFGKDTDNWAMINRGRAVLQSTDQLSQYLYSHGLMIDSQWDNLLASFSHDGTAVRIVDYGCGQGLAGVFLAAVGDENALSSAKEIVLIEPSPIALARAEAVYRALAPASEIVCVCKLFDDIEKSDLAYDGTLTSLHLFSNVLDIHGYNRFGLISKALTVGRHTILAVSHDRDHDGGSERIHSIERALNDPSLKGHVEITRSRIEKFDCSNPGRSAGIYWHCDLDVKNG